MEKTKVAYHVFEEPRDFYNKSEFYKIKINYNLYRSAVSKAKKKPKLGKLFNHYDDGKKDKLFQLTIHILNNGVCAYNERGLLKNKEKLRFITLHATCEEKVNECALELGLSTLLK